MSSYTLSALRISKLAESKFKNSKGKLAFFQKLYE